jgi:hypothetical protein
MKHWLPLLFLVFGAAGYGQTNITGNVKVVDENHVVPKALVDPVSKITFYLESDGRHISAIAPDGKVLWTHDPFVDSKLTPYRLPRPLISFFDFVDPEWWKIHDRLGKSDEFIGINYNSSQFGMIKKTTGDFSWFGQD